MESRLTALAINCTLKSSPTVSSTQMLLENTCAELKKLGVETEIIRLADYTILPGVDSDMGKGDEWPKILEKIKACQILLIGTPVWVGHTSSLVQRMIERLDAAFYEEELRQPRTGQYLMYNKVAGVCVTGNEDGAHECARHIQWALGEFGATIPPNANAYWVGEAGGQADYKDAGLKSEYTTRGYLYAAYNIVHIARLLQNQPFTTNLRELDKVAESRAKK